MRAETYERLFDEAVNSLKQCKFVMTKRAPVYILEGTWWSNHEVPLILPYFHALATSHREIDLSHRTIRGADDIAYYVSKISRNAGAFLYFACHGKRRGFLRPMAVRQ